ncbi:AsnC family transcriptional regulator, partial [Escherichia coli]
MTVTLDEIDRTLLAALQEDANWSVSALAERVN